jgi:hypothetical protein
MDKDAIDHGTDKPSKLNWSAIPLLMAMAISIVFPVGLALARLGLLVIAAVVGIASLTLTAQGFMSRTVRQLLLIGIVTGTLAGLLGLAYSNPGALPVMRVQVFWPMLFLMSVPVMRSRSDLKQLLHWLDWSAFAASFVTLFTTFSGGSPFGSYTTALLGDLSISEDPSQRQINLVTTLWLIFLLPYSICRLAARSETGRRPTLGVLVSVVAAFSATIVSGQRSIYIAGLIGVIIATLSRHSESRIWNPSVLGHKGRKSARRSGILAPIILLAAGVGLYLYGGGESARANLLSSWQNGALSDRIRIQEASVLWHNFLEAPIIGHGSGFVASELQRNTLSPWSYELLPLVILMTQGIIGSLLLFGSIGRMFWLLQREWHKDWSRFISPLLAGSASAAVASTINPVVTKLGTIWMLLIPLLALQVIDASRARDESQVKDLKTALAVQSGRFSSRRESGGR